MADIPDILSILIPDTDIDAKKLGPIPILVPRFQAILCTLVTKTMELLDMMA